MITWRGKLSEHIADPLDVAPWKAWLGEIDWRFFEQEHRLVFVSMPSATAEVINGEEHQLRDRLGLAYHAMLLTAPRNPFYGVSRLVYGEALSGTPPVQLKTIRGKQNLDEIQRPYFDTRTAYHQRLQSAPTRVKDLYLDRWANLVPVLERARAGGLSRSLVIAFDAFHIALTRPTLDFAIPELVRSVECIIALSKGMGRKEFAARALQLSPQVRNDWYVGGKGNEKRAKGLYRHRSDCVHGKVPFEDLLSQGTVGEDEAARFGYLAEAWRVVACSGRRATHSTIDISAIGRR
jgi:hypothetical protein